MAKSLLAGIGIALLGVMLSLLPTGLALEENIGLDLLFALRSPPAPPDDILIVSIELPESGRPKVSSILPRETYGRLIDILSARNARAIVFDLTFSKPVDPETDLALALAMQRFGHVILCEYLEREIPFNGANQNLQNSGIHIEKRILPIPIFAKNAALTAPFPLAKIPVRLNRFWTFKKGTGDQYTLPVAALQVYHREMYPLLRERIGHIAPDLLAGLPSWNGINDNSKQYDLLIRTLRELFNQNPLLAGQLLQQLGRRQENLSRELQVENKALTALIMMYGGVDSPYLNFYGPPGTIKTVPLEKILNLPQNSSSVFLPLDLTDTIVFVGLSQLSGKEQSDNFYTVFSRDDGVDVNGVEVAATAFANLLENKPITPLSPWQRSAVLIFWGLILPLICFYFLPMMSLLVVTGVSALFLLGACYSFGAHGIWFPLAIPLLVQAPVAYVSGILVKLFDTRRERRNIKAAFGHYLPDDVVDQMAKNMVDLKEENKIVHGLCLYTDAEHYTSVAEDLDPVELSKLMNKYYQAAFQPVQNHGGVVSDIVGDAMLAIWVSPSPKQDLRLQACLAALDIDKAVDEFNHSALAIVLPTRIGLHAGTMMLGNIGALKHYEYTPIGDVVNTASRLESLNKQLGTSLLVSDECVEDIQGLLVRKLGTFLLVGKYKPVAVSELLSRLDEASKNQLLISEYFDHGLQLFLARKWVDAKSAFSQVLEIDNDDGPAVFYIVLCEKYIQSPPSDDWNGVIRLQKK